MMPLTQEWVVKAEDAYNIARREYRARKNPSYDGSAYFSLQCAEKYLKARLQEASIPFPKTHNINNLLNLALSVEPTWANLHPKLQILTNIAVDVRYPGHYANRQGAKDALAICEEVRLVVRQSLGLP
jgi:HEPN domain-containing protein